MFTNYSLSDQRPLVKFCDQTFGSQLLDYENSLQIWDFYVFRQAVCDSFGSLRQCLDVVKDLFFRNISFPDVNVECQQSVLKLLGFSENKNLRFWVLKILAVAFSSFDDIMKLNLSDSGVSSFLGKDVLRIFQLSLGIAILKGKVSKATHLVYLAHA